MPTEAPSAGGAAAGGDLGGAGGGTPVTASSGGESARGWTDHAWAAAGDWTHTPSRGSCARETMSEKRGKLCGMEVSQPWIALDAG
jgi:hypothetical protein